jgi:hypothetical protein
MKKPTNHEAYEKDRLDLDEEEPGEGGPLQVEVHHFLLLWVG